MLDLVYTIKLVFSSTNIWSDQKWNPVPIIQHTYGLHCWYIPVEKLENHQADGWKKNIYHITIINVFWVHFNAS